MSLGLNLNLEGKHLSFSSSASLEPSGGATKGGRSSLLFCLKSKRLRRDKRSFIIRPNQNNAKVFHLPDVRASSG